MTSRLYNLYCDESCHLEKDKIDVMALGLISAPRDRVRPLSLELRALKKHYRCEGELKWTKVSMKNILFYTALVDYFFTVPDVMFRALVVHHKERLDHERYNDGSHDAFYYKMFYSLVQNVVGYGPQKSFQIFVDIKDNQGTPRIKKLTEVLRNRFYDQAGERIAKIQQIRSHEAELLQLTDFFLGAVTYATRGLKTNQAKLIITKLIRDHIGHLLTRSTDPSEGKFNLFHFEPSVP